MGGNSAEVAAAEAAAVGVHGEFNHVVGRDAFALVSRMRQLGKRQVPEGVHLLGGGRRIRRIYLHIAFPHRLYDGIRVHHVRMRLYPVEILRKRPFVPLAFFEGMQYQRSGGGRDVIFLIDIEGDLGNLLHPVAGPAFLDAPGELQHRAFAHAVAEVIGPGGNQDRGHQAVFPVIVVGEPAEGSLDAADDNGHIREEFLQDLGVHRDGVVRTGAGLAFGRVGIVVPKALGGRVVVHHGVHGAGIQAEVQPRGAQLAEIAEVVPPVGLGHHRHTVAPFLQPSAYHRRPEGRMVYEGVSREQDYINVIPSQGLHLLDGSRKHIVLTRHLRQDNRKSLWRPRSVLSPGGPSWWACRRRGPG